MSQILIYWTRGENTAFLNRSSKHFRCVPLRFPISILWEFNLIPTDISPGAVFLKKKIGNRKIRTDWSFFFLVQEHSGIWVSLSPFLSVSLSVHFYRDYFILFVGVLAMLATGLQGLLWTNPSTKPVITCQFIPSQTSYPHPSYYPHPSPVNHPWRYQNVKESQGAKRESCVGVMPDLRQRAMRPHWTLNLFFLLMGNEQISFHNEAWRQGVRLQTRDSVWCPFSAYSPVRW